jgi:hypothetical protein
MTIFMLHQLDEGIWEATGTLAMPFFVRFPIRMTVLRARSGELVLVSPIAIDDALAAAIDALGAVTTIVAPNLLHHLYAKAAKQRWPGAALVGPAALAQKRPDLTLDGQLVDGPLAPGVAVHALPGAPSIAEFVLLHAPSRTLVATDLVFNVRSGVNFATWLVFKLVAGTYGRLAPSRVWRFALRDRPLFRRALAALFEADFERLVVAHGEVVEAGGKAALRRALGAFTG